MTPDSIQMVGMLSDTPLVTLFQWIAGSAFTGITQFVCDGVKKSLVFEGGKPVAARSNIKEEQIGVLLLNKGFVTTDQLRQALQDQESKQEEMGLGGVLLKMGFLDPLKLHQVLHDQLLMRIDDLFNWKDGKYGLVKQLPENIAKIPIEESLMVITFRALVRKYKKLSQIHNSLSNSIPVAVGGQTLDINQLKLVGREAALYRTINGVNAFPDICSKVKMEIPVASAIVLSLRDLGFIRLGTKEENVQPTQSQSSKSASGGAECSKSTSQKRVSPEILKEVQTRIEAKKDQNLFELLGVAVKATGEEIKKSYFELAKKFHPDRLPDITAEERKIVELYFASISEAYTKLSNPKLKKEYETSLALEGEGVTTEQAHAVIQSEADFQKGLVFIRKRNFEMAIEALCNAISLYDKEPEYHMQLGWALFLEASRDKNQDEIQRGKGFVEKSLKMNPTLAQGFYYLGMIAKAEGVLDRSKAFFAKTLSLDQKHLEATSELRLINMREQKEQSGIKGLFRKKT